MNSTCSSWYRDRVLALFHQCLGHRFKKRITQDLEAGWTEYKDSTISAVKSVFSTILAAVVPPNSIFVLYFVTNILARLGIITGFSATVRLILGISTKARTVEVFAAIAAFASMQVVFVETMNPASP